MIRRHISLFQPYCAGLIILRIDGNPELVFWKFDDFRQEFPCPRNRLPLKVIAKGEVSKHLKEGLMTRRTSDILDVSGTNRTLTGNNTVSGRLHLSCKKRLQRCHTRTNQKKRRIIFRHKGVTGQTKVALFFCEKLQICFPQFVSGHILQRNRPPNTIFVKNLSVRKYSIKS